MQQEIIDYAKSHLHYDQGTGSFTWVCLPPRLNNKNLAFIGGRAGSSHHSGYWFITLMGKKVAAHRLAWAWVNGPTSMQIDHVNGDRSDNRIANLRTATKAQNMHNAKTKSVSSSGIKNVQWDSESGKWRVRVRVNGKRYHIGRFDKKDDALAAANEFMRVHHKEFARF